MSLDARTQHFSALIKSLMAALKHQQQKVRRSALQAIGSIVKNCGDSNFLPIFWFYSSFFDCSERIGLVCVCVCVHWFCSALLTSVSEVLPLLTQLSTDRAAQVREVHTYTHSALLFRTIHATTKLTNTKVSADLCVGE